MTPWLKQKLIQLIKDNALVKPQTESKKSPYKIDLSKVALLNEGAVVISTAIFEEVNRLQIDSIGGPFISSAPIVTSAIMRLTNKRGFFVRADQDSDIIMGTIEGNLTKGDKVVILDDVTTTGKKAFISAELVKEQYGCEIFEILSIVDKQAGAEQFIKNKGYNFKSLIQIQELLLT